MRWRRCNGPRGGRSFSLVRGGVASSAFFFLFFCGRRFSFSAALEEEKRGSLHSVERPTSAQTPRQGRDRGLSAPPAERKRRSRAGKAGAAGGVGVELVPFFPLFSLGSVEPGKKVRMKKKRKKEILFFRRAVEPQFIPFSFFFPFPNDASSSAASPRRPLRRRRRRWQEAPRAGPAGSAKCGEKQQQQRRGDTGRQRRRGQLLSTDRRRRHSRPGLNALLPALVPLHSLGARHALLHRQALPGALPHRRRRKRRRKRPSPRRKRIRRRRSGRPRL